MSTNVIQKLPEFTCDHPDNFLLCFLLSNLTEYPKITTQLITWSLAQLLGHKCLSFSPKSNRLGGTLVEWRQLDMPNKAA